MTEGSLLDQVILSSVNYDGDTAHYKQVIKTWLLALFTTSNSNPIRQAGGSRRVIVFPVVPRESNGNDEVYQSLGALLGASPAGTTGRDVG